MTSKSANRTPLRMILAFGLLATTAGFTAAPAFAGDCPADQVGVDVTKPGPSMPKDVTDEVITSIDLSSKGDAFKGTMFRFRKLVVQPGGIVPWHEHSARPANILVTEGSITEYRSTCKVPIEHAAGDVTAEFGPLAHWWQNNGKVPAILYSADILPSAMDEHTM